MRKILSLLMMVMFSVAVFAATETTVYYTASEATIGTKTVKLNINRQGDAENWQQYDMILTEYTYNGDPVYTYTYTDLYDGVGAMQFQLYDGDNWASQKEAISSWTSVTAYNGKMYVHATEQWVTAPTGEDPEQPEQPTVKFYVIGGADIVGEGKYDWKTEYALPCYTDTMTLSLAAGSHKLKVLTPGYAAWLGFEALTDTAAGLYTDGDTNICFELAEEGDVMVIYNSTVLKLIGNFAAAPAPQLPSVAIAGEMNSWSATANIMTAAEDGLTASVTIALEANNYEFKVVVGGHWLAKDATYDITSKNPAVEAVNQEIAYGPNLILHADVLGDYTFTWTYADNSLVVTFPDAPVVDEYAEILFVEAAAADDIAADASFTLVGSEFAATITDTGNKMTIDENNCRFGNAEAYKDYTHRLKSGGKTSGGTNFITFNIPEYGVLRIAARSASGSATDRNLVITQGETELYNQVVKDADKQVIEDINYFPYIEVAVQAGEVVMTYPTGALNFYAFAFKAVEESEPAAKFYITGNAALVGQDKEWNPGAIPSMEDSKVLSLEAGSYMMKLTMNGTWEGENNVKGYDALTGEIPAGVTRGEDENNDNICFTLAEAGDVTITYTAESFTIAGNFYVAPAPEPEAPTAAVIGSMTDWEVAIPFVLSADSLSATLADTIPAGEYEFKLLINGEYRSNGWWFNRDVLNAVITGNDDANMRLQADVRGFYKFTWFFANDSIAIEFPEVGPTPEPEAPTAAVIGSMTDWEVAIPFVLSADSLSATLADTIPAGDYEFKLLINGEFRSNGWWFNRKVLNAVITGNDDANMLLQADVRGFYKFTWFFANDSIAIEFPEAGPTPEPEAPTAAVIGSMTDWEVAIPFVLSADSLSATLADTIPAGDYDFKLLINGEYRSNGWWFNRNVLNAVITGNDDANMRLQADVRGFYKFTWFFANDSIAIEFPEAGPTPEPEAPTAAVIGSMTDWEVAIPFVLSADSLSATLADTIPAGDYEFKLLINGEYRSNGWWFNRNVLNAVITENVQDNMLLQADVRGFYKFTWFFANDSIAIEFPEVGPTPEPELANGYYLVGSMNDWTPAVENLFTANEGAENEYQLAISLSEGDSVKVVYVENDQILYWYPKGDNYVVDQNHAGATTMYFRPNYHEDWAAFGGYFFVVPTSTVDIINTEDGIEAVKVLRNGQLFIIKGDKKYNAQGQIVK